MAIGYKIMVKKSLVKKLKKEKEEAVAKVIYLPPDLFKELKLFSRKYKTPMTKVILQALRHALDLPEKKSKK